MTTHDSATTAAIATAYSATGSSWLAGPALVYDRLAAVLVGHSPVSLRGAEVIDIGAGTGAASSAALRAGARSVLAVDAAVGMLTVGSACRSTAVVADATRLPVGEATFDVAVAAFSFNHLTDPAAGFREAARVVKPGGAILASTWAADDDHPAKCAVEEVLRAIGWTPPSWQVEMSEGRAPQLATEAAAAAVIARAGLEATITNVTVTFDLTPPQMVAWRFGMAQHAPFVSALSTAGYQHAVNESLELLGADTPPLARSTMIVTVQR